MSKKKEETTVNPEDEEVLETPANEPSEHEKAQALAEDYKRKWYAVSAEYDNYR